MKKPPIPTYLTVAVIIACVLFFSLFLPWAVSGVLHSLLTLHQRYSFSDAWELPIVASISGMFLMGVPLGVHVGMLLTQRTIRLDCWLNRGIFTIASGVSAAIVTLYDLSPEGIAHDFTPAFRFAYLLLVQLPPLLWFAYNLNAQTLQTILAHRRKRKRS